MSKATEENTDASKENTAYAFHIMSLLRVVMTIPENFDDLAFKLISILPN